MLRRWRTAITGMCARPTPFASPRVDELRETVPGQGPQRRRRTPEEADALRARLVREGYPLPDLTHEENERIWMSLVARRRRPHVLRLLGMTESQIEGAIGRLRTQRLLVRHRYQT